jgi:diguanylate cyclase (GGDEF)-like protein
MTAVEVHATAEIPGARRLSWSMASALTLAVSSGAIAVLLAWATQSGVLQSFGPGPLGMKANTAFCLVLLSIAIWARRRAARHHVLIQRLAGAIVLVVAALTGLEYLLGINLALDQLVFADPATLAGAANPPGRMAPTTVISMVLLGAALLSPGTMSSQRVRRSSVLVWLSALFPFIALIGHIYQANALSGAFTQMSTETSLGLIALCIAAVAIAPHETVGAVVLRASAGGMVARRLVPASILVPITIGGGVLWGERAGLYDAAFGVLILIVAITVSFGLVAGWIAWTLDREQARRISAEQNADTDLLTGLGSRRAMVDQLERLVISAERNNNAFSVLAIDGDGLKQINDTHGHAAGDAALVRLAGIVVATLRDSDICGRVGGDEFLALLPDTPGREAEVIALRLRDALFRASGDLHLTASIGIGRWCRGMTAGELLLAADGALYEDKRARDLAS